MGEAVFGLIGLAIGGVVSIVSVVVKGRIDQKRAIYDHRVEMVKMWREGLANFEREAKRLGGQRMRAPDVQSDAWFTSFAQQADPELLELIELNRAEVLKRPVTEHGLREDVAVEIQREIGKIAKGWNVA